MGTLQNVVVIGGGGGGPNPLLNYKKRKYFNKKKLKKKKKKREKRACYLHICLIFMFIKVCNVNKHANFPKFSPQNPFDSPIFLWKISGSAPALIYVQWWKWNRENRQIQAQNICLLSARNNLYIHHLYEIFHSNLIDQPVKTNF